MAATRCSVLTSPFHGHKPGHGLREFDRKFFLSGSLRKEPNVELGGVGSFRSKTPGPAGFESRRLIGVRKTSVARGARARPTRDRVVGLRGFRVRPSGRFHARTSQARAPTACLNFSTSE